MSSAGATSIMTFSAFLRALRSSLSSQAEILTDSCHPDFQRSLQRWSDIDLRVPGAIIRPASEEDAVEIVRLYLLIGPRPIRLRNVFSIAGEIRH